MRIPLLVLLLGVAGCTADPFERPGTWSLPYGSINSNDANLRVMLQDPRDLVAGRGEEASLGAEASPPVRRLVTGRRPPLPRANASNVGSGPGPGQQQQTGPESAAPRGTP